MKKLLSIAVASLAVVAVAETNYSPSIGVTTLSLSAKNNVIPVQYTSLASSGAVTANALVCTNNIEEGSHLYIFADNSYTAWTLTENGWEAVDVTSTKPDGISAVVPATGQTLSTGSAIWLSFKTAPTTPVLVSVYGAVATESTKTTIAAGSSEAPKSSLVCNPTVSAVALSGMLSKVTPKHGDKIQFLGETYSGYYVYNETSDCWKKSSGTEPPTVANLAELNLNAYQGFWYVSKGGAGTIEW